jgi:4-amino-4-deoxy-L-arabinose transferase-like glycosyltransferase
VKRKTQVDSAMLTPEPTLSGTVGPGLRRARWSVAAAGLVALAFKLFVASTTAGTNDVRLFTKFAAEIGKVGPVDVYGYSVGTMVYNHGPITSLLLWAFSHLEHWGVSFPLLIRMPACFADFVTCLLVFELTRPRVGVRKARWCGIGVALSPVLIGVSGFHGNTDPVFVCLVLASVWMLSSHRRMVAAGIFLGLALSVKTVPVVVVPALLVAAYRHNRRSLVLFVAGFGATLVLLWGLPVLEHYREVKQNVLDYAGVSYRPWGIPKIASWAGVPGSWLRWWEGPGHNSIVVVSAGLGALLAWRRPKDLAVAVGLSLGTLLLINTASADQYLAWPAAGVFLVEFWSGLVYTVIAGAFLTELYARWSGGFPWNYAQAVYWTHGEQLVGAAIWAVLAVNVAIGTRLIFVRTGRRTAVPVDPRPSPALGQEHTARTG